MTENNAAEILPPSLFASLERSGGAAAGALASTTIKTKLTVTGHSNEGDITLAPRLHFVSFVGLKAQVERVLRSLPGSQALSILSLQYRDVDGDLIDLLESTFDPQDFDSLSNVVLRANVYPTRQQTRSPLPPTLRGKKTVLASATKTAAPRRVLGRRDANTLLAAPPPSAPPRGRGNSPQMAKATGRDYCSLRSSAGATQTPAPAATAPPAIHKKATSTRQLVSPVAVFDAESRVPEFVFGAGSRVSMTSTSSGGTVAPMRSANDRTAAAASRRRQRAVAAVRKPSWNNGNEPAWEEVGDGC